MSGLDRRKFLKLLGQGTAALGMGFSLSSGAAHAGEKSGTTAVSKTKSTKGKYQIFYPGKYLDWEKKAVEERFELAKKEPEKGRVTDEVQENDLLAFNRRWDPFNPLFNDKKYAQKAGYPNVPAWPGYTPPMASESSGASGTNLTFPVDFADAFYVSHGPDDMRFYTPIFAGDKFTSEGEKPTFEDITVPGSDLRHWKIGTSSKTYNQRGELAMWQSGFMGNAYRKILDGSAPPPDGRPWNAKFVVSPIHYTTDKEYEYIKELWKREYIRGSQKLYWEDVKVGDEPTWVCTGPIGTMEMIAWYRQGSSAYDIREALLKGEVGGLVRDRYGQYMEGTARHIFNMNNPEGRMFFYNDTPAKIITRMITNYIGDAGFVTRISWMFKQSEGMNVELVGGEYLDKVPYMKGKGCTEHGTQGDTVIGKGYVTDKYKNDKGEGIIDLVCWAETLDKDKIVEVCPVSARLPLKKG